MAMSLKTQTHCKNAITYGETFHNNTRLTGNDIHNQPRNYERDWSFSGEYNAEGEYEVYSYDKLIACRPNLCNYWFVAKDAMGISRTTDTHVRLLMQVIRDGYKNNYIESVL